MYKHRAILLICILTIPIFFSAQNEPLKKIALKNLEYTKKFVKITPAQERKLYILYLNEAIKIDSLKYLPKEYFENPDFGVNAIKSIKIETENKLRYEILTKSQLEEYIKNRNIQLDRRKDVK
jgi:hypothetical protein